MSFAGRFDFLLEACGTSQQCIDLANVASLAVAGVLLKQPGCREEWLTDLTGLAYELGARTATLKREEQGG